MLFLLIFDFNTPYLNIISIFIKLSFYWFKFSESLLNEVSVIFIMEPKIIRSNELKENNYGATKVTDILNIKGFLKFNIAKVRKVGDDIKLGFDTESDVAYYVLEGEGDCVINNKKYHVKKGDCLFYPKGTKYKHLKGLTLLAIASPPFDRKKRVYVE